MIPAHYDKEKKEFSIILPIIYHLMVLELLEYLNSF